MQKDELISRALKMRDKAYAPYSKFNVGATLLTASGKAFDGVNVENASFGMTICAERAAVAAAVAAGERKFTSIAIATDSPEPAVPCGACRQILAEFNPAMEIFCATTGGKQQRFTLTDLLPQANQGLNRPNV